MKRVNPYVVRSVEEVFADFNARRAGLIEALTTDVRIFYEQCDPNKENLCLYGLPNGTWEVNLPAEDVPPELPEPSLGINFARDGMEERDWLSLVAVHCDSWLLSVAFYFGARFEFGRNERKSLFMMINEQPTVFEAVRATFITPKEHAVPKNNIGRMASVQPEPETRVKMSVLKGEEENGGGEDEEESQEEEEEGQEEDDEQGATLCGACGNNYASDEFWICCDICETWFHGNCVKITPARAEQIKHYKCPACSKKARV